MRFENSRKTLFGYFSRKPKNRGKIKENDLSVFDFESLWIYHAYDILALNQEFENGKNVGWIYFREKLKLGQIFKKNFKYF